MGGGQLEWAVGRVARWKETAAGDDDRRSRSKDSSNSSGTGSVADGAATSIGFKLESSCLTCDDMVEASVMLWSTPRQTHPQAEVTGAAEVGVSGQNCRTMHMAEAWGQLTWIAAGMQADVPKTPHTRAKCS